ncbi:MAG: hypothetical protein E7509_05435 [Ruminococcus sp.]|nr:hypothetical protein [Ruminococcus sp.]
MNNTTIYKGRNSQIDIIKGIGIILMVGGHCGMPFTHFIYLFHMPLFFLMSGYLWKDPKEYSFSSSFDFLKRKLKGLLLPYFLTNAVFTLFNNVFINVGIYDESISVLSFAEVIADIIKSACFLSTTKLGAATWFYRVLFFVVLCQYIMCNIKRDRKFKRVISISFLIVVIIGMTIIQFKATLLYNVLLKCGLVPFFGGFYAFMLGVFIRQYKIDDLVNKRKIFSFIIALVGLIVLNSFGTVNLDKGQIINIFFFTLSTLLGWALLLVISHYVRGFIKKSICYISQHSVWIISLHFLSFKLVSFVYIVATNKDFKLLSSFPVIDNKPVLFLPYLVIGIVMPLLLCGIVNCIKNKIKQLASK